MQLNVFKLFLGTDWNVFSAITATVWRRSFVLKSTKTFKRKPSRTTRQDSSTPWRSSGPSSNTTGKWKSQLQNVKKKLKIVYNRYVNQKLIGYPLGFLIENQLKINTVAVKTHKYYDYMFCLNATYYLSF